MRGVIEGGWEFVVAAYVITAVVLLGYAFSVYWRLARAPRHGAGR
jgi:hypothetical protein